MSTPGPTSRRRFTQFLPAIFVWAVWLIMLAGALGFVAVLGTDLPFMDDFELVPIITGSERLSPALLWRQHNEHRIPFPLLVMLGLLKISGNDFRTGMFFNALGLGVAAFILIRSARRVRGSYAFTDALFPLALLNWGQFENLLWTFQTAYVLPVLLIAVVLSVIATTRSALTFRSVLILGICLLLLPTCGAPGLPYVLMSAPWLAWCGLGKCRSGSGRDKRVGVMAVILAFAALLVLGCYFISFHTDPQQPEHVPLWEAIRITSEFLSMSLGVAGMTFWPFSGWLAALLLACGGAVLVIRWWRITEDCFRSAGLLLFLGGSIGLALGVGWGRTWVGADAGFAPRYTALAAPGLFCAYLAWQVAGGVAGRVLSWSTCGLVVALLYTNMQMGITAARADFVTPLQSFEHDLLSAMPVKELATRYSQTESLRIYPDTEGLAAALRMLRDAGIKPFNQLPRDQSLEGSLDELVLSGWAWDRSEPNRIVTVEIYLGDKLLGKTRADQFRPDLLAAGMGHGRHGFSFRVPGELTEGQKAQLRVRIRGGNISLFGP